MILINNIHLTIVSVLAAAWCFSLAGNSPPPTSFKFDEFGPIPCAAEMARVDDYGNALRKQMQGLAVVIVSAGRSDTRLGEVPARLFGIRDRLTSASHIDQNRVVLLDGGGSEQLTVELWIFPADSRVAVTRMVDSQRASQKDIRLKSPRMEKWEYECSGGL